MNRQNEPARPPATAEALEKNKALATPAEQTRVNGDEGDALLTEIRDILILIHNLENEQLHVLRSINLSTP